MIGKYLNRIICKNGLIFCFLLIFSFILKSQTRIFNNNIYDSQVKTVQIFRKGWELSPPFMRLDGDDQLVVRFDCFKKEIGNYYYTIYQCKSDWSMSELVQQDYLEGFYENPITKYKYSSNTTVNYINYEFAFPNDDIKITKSGNYVVIVYEDFNLEKIVLTRRFFVYESLININAMIKRPMLATQFNKGQEVDITIKHDGYDISNPHEELKTVIVQNMDWNTRISDLIPTFIKENELVFDYDEENIFPGLSEFRYFDIKSMRYQSEYIASITYDYYYHHVILTPSGDRHFTKYFYNDDINGKYLVDVQEFPDATYEADYVMVHFTLPYDAPVVDGNIHIYGALTDWQISKESEMTYNFNRKAYECSLLLKQGYYNYFYVLNDTLRNNIDMTYIEGSHYETENDYFIFVYHHPFHLRYDRLIGIQVLNSVRKNISN